MHMQECCHENTFCRSLDSITNLRICKKCVHLTLNPKQELIFNQSSRKYAIVKSGLVISIFLTEEGKQKSIEIFSPGSFIKMNDLYNNGNDEYYYLEALTPATLCLFSNTLFNDLFSQNPVFANTVLEATNLRLKSNLRHLLHVQTDNSEDKVNYILDLLHDVGIDVSLLTHEDIALLTDLNRVTVTRALKNINRSKEAGR
ncbi:Crp/Fnr family transcriptional regulator [Cytobacillus sp. Hz8]|uniref:Crp/Fnr family transcriptional regulator n=1 Tax=Cytobacillus sp. Hz8 TaxID=3347168 RepID=UPI0035E044BE